MVEGALEVERLFLRKLCEGNLETRLLYCYPGRYVVKALEAGNSLHRRPVGKHVKMLTSKRLREMDEEVSSSRSSLSKGAL